MGQPVVGTLLGMGSQGDVRFSYNVDLCPPVTHRKCEFFTEGQRFQYIYNDSFPECDIHLFRS